MRRLTRRQQIALGGLAVALLAVVWWQMSAPDAAGVSAGARVAPARDSGTGPAFTADSIDVPAVALSRLAAEPAEPVDTGRDPFRFGEGSRRLPGGDAAAPPPGAPAPPKPGVPDLAMPAAPAGPPPPPPIPLKFIGLVRKQGEDVKIAVLSDSRGVYHGREGDIVEGRYRIVRIGTDTVELTYVDGRGRQVIRLSGS